MAKIIFGSYMVRYPLGGGLSASLQWLVGFKQLGHDVYLVEKSGWAGSCYDPSKNVMGDNCDYGTKTIHALLKRFGLQDRWCFVDANNLYHGLDRRRIEAVFRSADIFIDRGTHGDWLSEAQSTKLRVLVDGEPGATQMKMEKKLPDGEELPNYDYYYTVGRNVGTEKSTIPTQGKDWKPLFPPVVLDLFSCQNINTNAPYTTVMNWRSHDTIEFNGKLYGQKDVEFGKFMSLPSLTSSCMEIAVSGESVPFERLKENGWSIRDAHKVTTSFDSYAEYIRESKGEFSVGKNIFVETNCGWFSDRSAVYLASGRPVVLQDTGFGQHLPCGEGLFAVRTVEEAADAINEINCRVDYHSKMARMIAREHLDARKILRRFLCELGL